MQIYCEVIPKRQALAQVNAELEMATAKLLSVQRKLEVNEMMLCLKNTLYIYLFLHFNGFIFVFVFLCQDLDASVQSLTAQFEQATAEKISCQEEVARTNHTIELAHQLVRGLEVKKKQRRRSLVWLTLALALS